MLSLTQWLILEAGPDCNLAGVHTWCPNRHPDRFSHVDTDRVLDAGTMADVAIRAHRDFGFRGLVGFHYYCDPLVYAARLGHVMDKILASWPAARFGLWTNGELLEQEAAFVRRFRHVRVSDYGRNYAAMAMRVSAVLDGVNPAPEVVILSGFTPDNRATSKLAVHNDNGCTKPWTEFILDCYGNHHVCCYAWRGEDSLGNLYRDGLDSLLIRWQAMQEAIVGERLTDAAPAVCRTCAHKCTAWNNFVPEVFFDQRDRAARREACHA